MRPLRLFVTSRITDRADFWRTVFPPSVLRCAITYKKSRVFPKKKYFFLELVPNSEHFAKARRSSQPIINKAHRWSSYVDHTCDGRRAVTRPSRYVHSPRILFATRPSIVTRNIARENDT